MNIVVRIGRIFSWDAIEIYGPTCLSKRSKKTKLSTLGMFLLTLCKPVEILMRRFNISQ